MLKVYAQDADYLEITVSNGLEFNDAVIHCPTNGIKGNHVAPCILDASGGGVIDGIIVYAPNGIPYDFWLDQSGTANIQNNGVQINCVGGSAVKILPIFIKEVRVEHKRKVK